VGARFLRVFWEAGPLLILIFLNPILNEVAPPFAVFKGWV
jgi:hypothetical protein